MESSFNHKKMALGAIFLIGLCTVYVDKHVHKPQFIKISYFCEFDKFLFLDLKDL